MEQQQFTVLYNIPNFFTIDDIFKVVDKKTKFDKDIWLPIKEGDLHACIVYVNDIIKSAILARIMGFVNISNRVELDNDIITGGNIPDGTYLITGCLRNSLIVVKDGIVIPVNSEKCRSVTDLSSLNIDAVIICRISDFSIRAKLKRIDVLSSEDSTKCLNMKDMFFKLGFDKMCTFQTPLTLSKDWVKALGLPEKEEAEEELSATEEVVEEKPIVVEKVEVVKPKNLCTDKCKEEFEAWFNRNKFVVRKAGTMELLENTYRCYTFEELKYLVNVSRTSKFEQLAAAKYVINELLEKVSDDDINLVSTMLADVYINYNTKPCITNDTIARLIIQKSISNGVLSAIEYLFKGINKCNRAISEENINFCIMSYIRAAYLLHAICNKDESLTLHYGNRLRDISEIVTENGKEPSIQHEDSPFSRRNAYMMPELSILYAQLKAGRRDFDQIMNHLKWVIDNNDNNSYAVGLYISPKYLLKTGVSKSLKRIIDDYLSSETPGDFIDALKTTNLSGISSTAKSYVKMFI